MTGTFTLPEVYFKHFASKNQLPGLSVSGILVKNGMKVIAFFLLAFTDQEFFTA